MLEIHAYQKSITVNLVKLLYKGDFVNVYRCMHIHTSVFAVTSPDCSYSDTGADLEFLKGGSFHC